MISACSLSTSAFSPKKQIPVDTVIKLDHGSNGQAVFEAAFELPCKQGRRLKHQCAPTRQLGTSRTWAFHVPRYDTNHFCCRSAFEANDVRLWCPRSDYFDSDGYIHTRHHEMGFLYMDYVRCPILQASTPAKLPHRTADTSSTSAGSQGLETIA